MPAGSSGQGLTPADFVETAGILNKKSMISPIISPARRYGVLLNGAYDLTSSVELFTELTFARSEIDRTGTDVFLNGEFGSYRVPASNPYNPFGVEVAVNYLMPGRPDTTLKSDYRRTLLGARGSLGAWNWEMAGWESREEADQINFFNTTEAIRTALASSDPATALNPFQDGPGGSPELIASFFEGQLTPFSTQLRGVNGYLRGSLWRLPAGNLEALLGGEYEQQELVYTSALNGAVTEGDRSKRALFAELRAPLLANRGDPGAAALLTLTGAARVDRDSSFDGSGLSNTVGLEFRPLESLLLRGTYNTAFKPPILFDAVTAPRTIASTVRDPRFDGALTPILLTTAAGVPPSIEPERGESSTLGLIFSPQSVPLNFTLTHWKNQLRDRIVAVLAQFIVDNESAFPGRVTRDPSSGVITAVDGRQVNVNFVNTAGVDAGVNGHWQTRFGRFFPGLAATYTYEYETQVRPTSPIVDGVSKAAAGGYAPRWKGALQLGWEHRDLHAQITGRYVGRYDDYEPLPDGPMEGTVLDLGDVWFVDLSLSYALGRALAPPSSWLSGLTLGVTATNLFDRLPDFSTFSGNGYDASQYDIRGRYISARVKVSF